MNETGSNPPMMLESTSPEGRSTGHGNTPLIPQTTAIDLFLTAKEAARIIPLHHVTILKWVREGRIPHRRLGRKIIFPLSKLNAWLASEYNAPVAHAA